MPRTFMRISPLLLISFLLVSAGCPAGDDSTRAAVVNVSTERTITGAFLYNFTGGQTVGDNLLDQALGYGDGRAIAVPPSNSPAVETLALQLNDSTGADAGFLGVSLDSLQSDGSSVIVIYDIPDDIDVTVVHLQNARLN